MTLPPNIRVNTLVPFPALVQGTAPVTVSKSNGVWTIALNMPGLSTENITSGTAPNQYVLVYDATLQAYFQVPASTFSTVLATTRNQTVLTSSPYTVQAADQDLFVKLAAPGTMAITMPAASGRAGNTVRVKDLGGGAAANNITMTAAGSDIFDDGATTYKLNTNFEEREFVPVLASSQWYWSVR